MRIAFAAMTLLAACGSTETAVPTSTTTTTIVATTTTTTTTSVPRDPPRSPSTTSTLPGRMVNCPEWEQAALDAGWPIDLLERLDYVVWRESRCLPHVHNADDPATGSRGLAQINGFWCRPSRYYADGWLQTEGILDSCEDLYDPEINLAAARAIWLYAEDRGCGWSPWATRSTRWC